MRKLAKRVGEVHDQLTIIAESTKEPNGYQKYYWCKCSCGNYLRARYDVLKKKGSCTLCDDFKASVVNNGKEE